MFFITAVFSSAAAREDSAGFQALSFGGGKFFKNANSGSFLRMQKKFRKRAEPFFMNSLFASALKSLQK